MHDSRSSISFAVVINTYKRDVGLVVKCLRKSLEQKIKPHKVILIDQNKIELKLPEDIKSNPLFERQKTSAKSISAARNQLIIPEGADWIFFCDDDGYPEVNYSEELFKIISQRPEIDMLAGKIVRNDINTSYTIRQKHYGSLKKFRNTKKLMGANIVVRAKIFDELERFDENFGAGAYWGSSEDTDLCWKAYFKKKEIDYFPELIVYHLPPFQESMKVAFKKSFKYGKGKGALVFKWLIKKRKFIVLYEFFEMLIVPVIHIVRGILTLRFTLCISGLGSFWGRVYGLAEAILRNKF